MNVHGTAFGGSIFTSCLLTGWSLVSALLPSHSVVAQTVDIDYKKPVTGPYLFCHAVINSSSPETKIEEVLEIRKNHSRSKVFLTVSVFSSDKSDSVDISPPPQAIFHGKYHCQPIVKENKEEKTDS